MLGQSEHAAPGAGAGAGDGGALGAPLVQAPATIVGDGVLKMLHFVASQNVHAWQCAFSAHCLQHASADDAEVDGSL